MIQSPPQSIYESLKERLVNGEFAPNQKLKPENLRHDYGCSASTLREVLFRLSTVDLVDFQEQRGFRLPGQSPELRRDLSEFRILLECEGVVQSIRRGGVAWEARLTATHHKLSHIEMRLRTQPLTDELLRIWVGAELEFHQGLIEACGSEILKKTHDSIYHQFRQQLITTDKEFRFLRENVAQHQGILDAVLNRDEAKVQTLIRAHLSRSWKVMDEALSQGDEAAQ